MSQGNNINESSSKKRLSGPKGKQLSTKTVHLIEFINT